MTNWNRNLLAICAALLTGATLCAQQTQWLQYRTWTPMTEQKPVLVPREIPASPDAPKDLQIPKLDGAAPLFASWDTPMVRSGRIWMAFTRARSDGPYDKMYISSKADGRLDAAAIIPRYIGGQQAYFGPVKLLFPGEDGPITYHLLVTVSTGADRPTVRVQPDGWYEGTIEAGGKKWRCLLMDRDVNGTFNDASLDFDKTDRIWIGQGDDLVERFVGRYVQIGDALYALDVARDGAFIRLKAAGNVPMGKLIVSEGISALSVGGENGLWDAKLDKGAADMPAGKYRVHHWEIKRNDKEGVEWQLRGSDFPDKSVFEIRAGKETRLDLGEPIPASLRLEQQKNECTITYVIAGKQGENLSLLRAGVNPEAPKVRIRSQDGIYDSIFRLEYG